ncbi:hypothetical protein MLD38_029621 [Melastoma candidum]|uniref:Uncharacterized protein n=1 Tax=Melastoma candidum TaxID=119954 RepID=A0ACB9N559_9MYRT|nr:hypothetical protein MLD38_029621 [Melastoma candidum]
MDSSRRAVESYWRSRMIDEAASNEDKVTPVYKLEEICELLRSSHVGIVKEISGFVLKRLEHKSPVVKQKALRLIKYCVGKSGVEFQREMQRHSVVIRQMIHYKGQADPLKGDALNKAVRETAQEALSSIFSEVENKPAPAKTLDKRIEGFGNTNFPLPSEEKKSFLSEVVNLGSASIRQGLSNLAQSHSMGKNDNGSYRSPNLHRSLTMEREDSNGYEPVRLHGEARSNKSGNSNGVASASSNYSFGASRTDSVNGDYGTTYMGKTREDKLVETIVTSGGVRLQPTRDAIQVFLSEASKLDGLALSRALELKLQSPQWQIRMKALCVLDSVLRRKVDDPFSIVSSYFSENFDALVKCYESPQASLRDKAVKVLRLLEVEESKTEEADSEKPKKVETQMPDLIDTGSDLFGETDVYPGHPKDSDAGNISTHGGALIDDLLGDGTSNVSKSHLNNDDDPFSDVSFYTDPASNQVDDLFAGMSLSDKKEKNMDPFPTPSPERTASNVDDLLAGFAISGSESESKQDVGGQNMSKLQSIAESFPPQQAYNDALSSMLGSQMPTTTAALGNIPVGVSPGLLFNLQPQQPLNYGPGAMNNLLLQQQYLAMMSNLQQFGYLNTQAVDGMSQVASDKGSSTSAPFPNIFQNNFIAQTPTSVMSNSRREDTKAFDFISDHLATARDTKRFL